MDVTAIAAVGRNGAIGHQGDVPWHIPEDWRRFKAVTMGGSLIMGRTTFEAIGRPLPGRTSIVVTRRPPAEAERDVLVADGTPPTRVIWVTSIEEALATADPNQKVWIGGGAVIYRLAWPLTTHLDICEVDQSPEADAFFPEIDPAVWQETSRDPRDGYAFVTYRRVSDAG